MGGITVKQAGSITELLELYSERLASLREDMRTVQQKVDALAADFQSALTVAIAAEESANSSAYSGNDIADFGNVASLDTHDPEIGTEIEIICDEPIVGKLQAQNALDVLTDIAGIDEAAEQTLRDFGIDTYAKLAKIDADEVIAIGMVLGDADRIAREVWIAQANERAHGDGVTDREDVVASATFGDSNDDSSTIQRAAGPRKGVAADAAITDDQIFDDLVIEEDLATRDLIVAAAALAKIVAAEKERERAAGTAGAETASAKVIEIAPALAAAVEETKSVDAGTGAEVIDLAARRAAKSSNRRPRAIAASIAVLLVAAVAAGASYEHILGFDLTSVASCSEALLQGDTTCVGFPASSF